MFFLRAASVAKIGFSEGSVCVFFGPFGFPGAPVCRLFGLWGLEVEPYCSQVGPMPFIFSRLSSHTRGFWQLSGPIGAQVVAMDLRYMWAMHCNAPARVSTTSRGLLDDLNSCPGVVCAHLFVNCVHIFRKLSPSAVTTFLLAMSALQATLSLLW